MTTMQLVATSDRPETLETRDPEAAAANKAMEAEVRRATLAPVRQAMREVQARAREALRHAGSEGPDEFILAAAALALRGELVFEAGEIYMRLIGLKSQDRGDSMHLLELRCALARFLVLQHQVPGRTHAL